TYNATSYSYITQQRFARLRTVGQRSLARSIAHDLIFSCQYQSNVPPPQTTELTPFQPIQST
ncbi:17800_t:CDS:2, partial [Gigaspora margarita]